MSISRAAEIWKNEGFISLFKKTFRFGKRESTNRIKHFYWANQPPIQLTASGVSATFDRGPIAGNITELLESEREQLEEVISYLQEDDTFYDVGAHIGLYTCFAANKLASGNVIAFEPFLPNCDQLQQNASYNRNNINIYKIALSDKGGEVGFTSAPDPRHTGRGAVGFAVDSTAREFTVATRPGDTLLTEENIPSPDVVKIDVEGATPLVVEGMKDTLQEECRGLFIELHPPGYHPSHPSIEDFGMSVAELQTEIEQLGFQIEYVKERGDERHLKAVK